MQSNRSPGEMSVKSWHLDFTEELLVLLIFMHSGEWCEDWRWACNGFSRANTSPMLPVVTWDTMKT